MALIKEKKIHAPILLSAHRGVHFNISKYRVKFLIFNLVVKFGFGHTRYELKV